MDKFNSQFATQKLRQEMSVTGTGASFTPGTGEQMATNKAFKKKQKKEVKDVEPKLAAGKAKVYAKEKWGWTPAPSVPNRPSKGGFIYKQLFEELSFTAFNHYRSTLNDAYGDLVRDNNPGAKLVGAAYDSLNIKDNPESISKLDAAKDVIIKSKLVDQQKNTYLKVIDKIKEYLAQNSQKNTTAVINWTWCPRWDFYLKDSNKWITLGSTCVPSKLHQYVLLHFRNPSTNDKISSCKTSNSFFFETINYFNVIIFLHA
jgi:hypothetical protein